MLHYKAVARNRFWRVSDIALCIFGVIAMGYTTSLTVMNWVRADPDQGLPGYCDGR